MNELVYLNNDEAVCDSLWKSVYVLLADDGTIKIGVSKNVLQRIGALQGASGKKIIESFCTPKCSNAYFIESIILKHYLFNKTYGEWINGNYTEVVNYTKEIFEKVKEFKPSKEFDVHGAWSIFEKMCPALKEGEKQINIMNMSVLELKGKLKNICDGFSELCGEDDEICTIPAKEMYKQLLENIDFVLGAEVMKQTQIRSV